MMAISGDSSGRAGPIADDTLALFDTWLQTSLQQRYDRTLDEPVPPEILDLVQCPTDRQAD